MKKKLILCLLCGMLFLNGCSFQETLDREWDRFLEGMDGIRSAFGSISVEEFQDYLETAYGADKGFTLVEKGDCNWFELGTGTHYFTADGLDGRTFWVTGHLHRHNNKTFEDNFVPTLYEYRLKESYLSCFPGLFDEPVEIFNLSVWECDTPSTTYASLPLLPYKEIWDMLSQKRVHLTFCVNIWSDPQNPFRDLDSGDKSISQNDWVQAREKLEDLAEKRWDIEGMRQLAQSSAPAGLERLAFLVDGSQPGHYSPACAKAFTLYDGRKES